MLSTYAPYVAALLAGAGGMSSISARLHSGQSAATFELGFALSTLVSAVAGTVLGEEAYDWLAVALTTATLGLGACRCWTHQDLGDMIACALVLKWYQENHETHNEVRCLRPRAGVVSTLAMPPEELRMAVRRGTNLLRPINQRT